MNEEQYKTVVAINGEEGLKFFDTEQIDLIILDIMLPGLNGLMVCSKIREKSNVPILMLTALGTAENVALGLNMGADDYLTKPFKFIELIARVRSLLRRTEHIEKVVETIYTFEDVVINDEQKTVQRSTRLIQLTSTEYRLLLMLIMNPRKVFSRVEIIEEVWGIDFDVGTNIVDVYVNYLLKKLE